MNQSDKIIFGFIIGASFPILFSLIAMTVGFYFFKTESLPYFFFAGLLTGLLIDIVYLKRLLNNILDIPIGILAGFYIFHNVIIYGLFMGFPVFNLVMGVVAGYYFGRRINYKNITSGQREIIIKKVSLFSGLIMLIICISSGLIALSEKTIGSELQNMLGLGFVVTKGMIIGTIIIGGLTLIISQYYLTRIVMIKTIIKKK